MAGTCGYGEGLSGSINAGNFLTSCKVYWLASQEGLCSMEEVSTHCMYCMYNKSILKIQSFEDGENLSTLWPLFEFSLGHLYVRDFSLSWQ